MAETKKGRNPPRALNVLYLDDMIAVVEKPAGIPVQGGEKAGISLTEILSAQLGYTVFPVHRLDKDTAGILVTALSKSAAALYSEYFRKKRIIKGYHAVCIGMPHHLTGRISIPLEKRGALPPTAGRAVMQSAETLYSVEKASAGGEFSLLSVRIETGRNHQIRRHFALEGFPVAADDKYGDFKRNREIKKLYGVKKLQLAATSIALPVASGNGAQSIELSCPLPQHIREFAALIFASN